MSEPPPSFEDGPVVAEAFDWLRDGSRVLVRPPRPTDGEHVLQFLHRTSRKSIESRFFYPTVLEDTALAEINRTVNPSLALSLLLFHEGENGWEPVGHGEYVRDGVRSPNAEIAFLVMDAYQGQGVATVLLTHLARVARGEGIGTFRAMLLLTNFAMLDVLQSAGFPYAIEYRPDQIIVTLSIRDEPHPSFARHPEVHSESGPPVISP